jgi:predicted DNA-binding WGR domain protein
MSSYGDAIAAAFEKIRPELQAQITKSCSAPVMFYLHKKGLAHAVKHFENRKDGKSKFWKVYPPYKVNATIWGVRVEFGRIGTNGQTRVHAEKTEDIAWRYYHDKLTEKKARGYVQVEANNDSAKLKHVQAAAKRKLKKDRECDHATLTAAGKNKWKCGSCSTVIEFGKSLNNQTKDEVDEAVRYINLGGLDD